MRACKKKIYSEKINMLKGAQRGGVLPLQRKKEHLQPSCSTAACDVSSASSFKKNVYTEFFLTRNFIIYGPGAGALGL